MSVQYRGIEFQKISAGSVYLGTEKGGWIYASQRPRHEVKCPDFYIMQSVLSEQQIKDILQQESHDIKLDGGSINEICRRLSDGVEGAEFLADSGDTWEIRSPSEGEWRHAHEKIGLELNPKKIEILADGVADNYRGAMMDGRPRSFYGIGPMASHRTAIETHPSQEGVTALSSAPMDRPLDGIVTRLVITPIRTGEGKKVPLNADFFANIRGEVFWTLLLGVVPSFVIPIARGMGGYAVTGWANLLFGGLCVGFVTGVLWRPRRPTLQYDDIEESTNIQG